MPNLVFKFLNLGYKCMTCEENTLQIPNLLSIFFVLVGISVNFSTLGGNRAAWIMAMVIAGPRGHFFFWAKILNLEQSEPKLAEMLEPFINPKLVKMAQNSRKCTSHK